MQLKEKNGIEKKQSRMMRLVMFAIDRREVTLVILILALGAFLTWVSPNFLSAANFSVMLNAIGTDIIVAVPMAFCMIAGHSDFSVGSNVCLSSILAGMAMNAGASPIVGILIGLACGAILGYIMGFAVNHKVPTFVATLGGMYAYRGIAMVLCGATSITGFERSFLNLGRFTIAGIRAPIIYAAIMIIIGHFVLKYVNFFHNAYYIGSNVSSATLAGINSKKYLSVAFTLTGLFCGVAGLVLCARVGSVSVNTATDLHFKNIVGLMVGGVSNHGGTGSLIGGMLGILFMQMLDNALVMLYIDPNYNQIFIGAILILAVALDQFVSDYRAKVHT
ncbi:MAG: ABC transporter permease [Oscillibacter sp.]|nr:ABC transporter permease [Oscillibacter sp.]